MPQLKTKQAIKDFSDAVNKTLVPMFRDFVDSMKNLSTKRFTCDKELELRDKCDEQCEYCQHYFRHETS